MQKTILSLYQRKVARGDRSYLKRLCRQISDKHVFVPVINTVEVVGKQSLVRVKVPSASTGLFKSSIPVFTSREYMRVWIEDRGNNNGFISICCADLCSALDKRTSIEIDPNTENAVRIGPRHFDLFSTESEESHL